MIQQNTKYYCDLCDVEMSKGDKWTDITINRYHESDNLYQIYQFCSKCWPEAPDAKGIGKAPKNVLQWILNKMREK